MEIDVWADVVCPWCLLGKRRFEAALERFEDRDDVTVRWRSFELDPAAPREHETDAATRLAEKYGMSLEEVHQRHAQLEAMGAEEGAEFHFDRVRGGNTFDAHRLVQLAADRGLQDAVIERIMHANFADGEAIGDPATLERLAVEAGLDAHEAREVLLTDRYGETVREDERLAASVGITGVPCFVVDRRLAVSGAQPPDVLLQLLREGRARAA